ncbi:ACOT7 [Branchiostoma lanceolatum]|uniref:ACOT7 protein n=2 Tax=Branchiostoma lanceolatum TaxID=7740 RepID=A0A8J9VWY7_BRALA|nr:ACOT7 [Branchiostoma lanceolatum]
MDTILFGFLKFSQLHRSSRFILGHRRFVFEKLLGPSTTTTHSPFSTSNRINRSKMAACSTSPAIVSRIMRPDDANISGNVHGGNILKMIEEAGIIVGARHCNRYAGEEGRDPCAPSLVRIERMDFLQPMHVGEVAQLQADVTYTGPHSLEVQVHVWAENVLKGSKRLTNKAALWYVPVSTVTKGVAEVPPMIYSSQQAEEAGQKRYDYQKVHREENDHVMNNVIEHRPMDLEAEPHTVRYSQSSLIHLVNPSDTAIHGFATGGCTLKLMDEVAGITAARHAKNRVVTASIEATNFHRPVPKGSLMHLMGRITFTSSRTMEIEVAVDLEKMTNGGVTKERAVTSFFTFVSLGADGKPIPIPPLKVTTDDERSRFEEGKERYERKKAERETYKKLKVDT